MWPSTLSSCKTFLSPKRETPSPFGVIPSPIPSTLPFSWNQGSPKGHSGEATRCSWRVLCRPNPPGLEEIAFFFCFCFLRDYYWILSKRSCLVGFIKSGLSSSVSSSNSLGCFGPILPRRTTDILDTYLNVFLKSLESYKWSGMTSPRVKREEKFMRNELGVWIYFSLGQCYIQKLMAERLWNWADIFENTFGY